MKCYYIKSVNGKTAYELREAPKPHDAADGVAVALCHHFRAGGPAAGARLRVGGGGSMLTRPVTG